MYTPLSALKRKAEEPAPTPAPKRAELIPENSSDEEESELAKKFEKWAGVTGHPPSPLTQQSIADGDSSAWAFDENDEELDAITQDPEATKQFHRELERSIDNLDELLMEEDENNNYDSDEEEDCFDWA